MHILACGHARTTVRVAYGRAILFLLVNDANKVPEIAVVLDNLGRVSLDFLSSLLMACESSIFVHGSGLHIPW